MRDIAQACSISEYTVQEHLSHAFDKVGVRGRRALVQRLFLDNLYPGLCGSAEAERADEQLSRSSDVVRSDPEA